MASGPRVAPGPWAAELKPSTRFHERERKCKLDLWVLPGVPLNAEAWGKGQDMTWLVLEGLTPGCPASLQKVAPSTLASTI